MTAAAAIDWDPIRRELDAHRAAGRTLTVWLRDDDAIEPTPALDRLLSLAERFAAPVSIAVVPRDATPALAARLAAAEAAHPHVHGWAHQDHAAPGAKKTEFGPERPLASRVADAEAGLARLSDLFGDALRPIFTPPWNRAAPDLAPALAPLGFRALSTFRPRPARFAAPGLEQVNAHVDPIDWRFRRLAAPGALVAQTAGLLADRRSGAADADEPLGLLTHHLAHDEAVWDFVSGWLEVFADAPDVARFVAP